MRYSAGVGHEFLVSSKGRRFFSGFSLACSLLWCAHAYGARANHFDDEGTVTDRQGCRSPEPKCVLRDTVGLTSRL